MAKSIWHSLKRCWGEAVSCSLHLMPFSPCLLHKTVQIKTLIYRAVNASLKTFSKHPILIFCSLYLMCNIVPVLWAGGRVHLGIQPNLRTWNESFLNITSQEKTLAVSVSCLSKWLISLFTLFLLLLVSVMCWIRLDRACSWNPVDFSCTHRPYGNGIHGCLTALTVIILPFFAPIVWCNQNQANNSTKKSTNTGLGFNLKKRKKEKGRVYTLIWCLFQKSCKFTV